METNLMDTGGVCQNETSNNANGNEAQQNEQKVDYDNGSERGLNAIATIILVLGVSAAFICLFIGLKSLGGYRSEEELAYTLIKAAVYLFFSSITVFALLRVICNISNNLHKINRKIGEDK